MTFSKEQQAALRTIKDYIQDYIPQDDNGSWFYPNKPVIKKLGNYPTVTTSDSSARYIFSKKLPIVSGKFYLQEDYIHGKKRMFLLNCIADDGLGFGQDEFEYHIRCGDLIELAKWIREASLFINSKEIFYIPEIIEIHKYGRDGWLTDQDERPYFSIDTTKMKFKVFNPTLSRWPSATKGVETEHPVSVVRTRFNIVYSLA